MKKLIIFLAILFIATSAYSMEVTLGWGESTGATGYKIYWGQTLGNYVDSVDAGNVLQHTVTLPSGAYYFVVTAYNATDESGHSDYDFLDTLPIDAPSGYTTEATKVGNDYQVIHSCPTVQGAVGYKLFQDEVVVYDGGDPTFTQTLQPGTYDFYWIAYKPRQIDSAGTLFEESPRSVEKTLHLTVPAAPSQPTFLMVVP